MMKLMLCILLVAWLACQGTAGASCRFANTTARDDVCVFPCRCTNGCNVTTGACVNNGQCKDGFPRGLFKWEGPTCQKGNVAYNKTAEQSNDGDQSGQSPAVKAVDGYTDTSQSRCATAKTTSGKNAWWMVDLGKTHRIFEVIIYNGGSCCNRRLDTFILSVGDSRDISTHAPCATHTNSVRTGGHVNVTCLAIGRYVSFKRNKGFEANIATLCEVVVIGHRYTDCSLCPSQTECNEVTGCEECASGKKLPDCVKDCDSGTYGVNCAEKCGHCKDNSTRCEAASGRCFSGCKMWFALDTCKIPIPVPNFKSSERPELAKITSSTAVARWRAAGNISAGAETHYYYIVWLEQEGETERSVARVPHAAHTDWFEARVDGLEPNRQYSVSVKPYRQHKEERQGGRRTAGTVFKTGCIVPERPVITAVKTPSPDDSACAYMVVNWQVPGETGCDVITAVNVWYKRQLADTWARREAGRVNQTTLTIDYLTFDSYEVKVTATNNENFTAVSEVFVANLHKSNSLGVNLNIAAVVGLVVAAFVLGAICAGVASFVHRRARPAKLTNLKKPKPKRALPPPAKVDFAHENRAVTFQDDDACYMEPKENEDNVYDDIGNYIAMTGRDA